LVTDPTRKRHGAGAVATGTLCGAAVALNMAAGRKPKIIAVMSTVASNLLNALFILYSPFSFYAMLNGVITRFKPSGIIFYHAERENPRSTGHRRTRRCQAQPTLIALSHHEKHD
jgi:hypothetical protein